MTRLQNEWHYTVAKVKAMGIENQPSHAASNRKDPLSTSAMITCISLLSCSCRKVCILKLYKLCTLSLTLS